VREAVGEVAARLENNIAGITVVKSFTAEAFEQARVEAASNGYRNANLNAIRLSAVFTPLIRTAIALGFAGVIVLGGWLAMRGRVSPGEVVLFGMLIQRMLWPLTRIGTTFDDYQRAKASAARVFALLDTEPRVRDPEHPREIPHCRGEIRFENVGFAYTKDQPVLNGLDFTVAPGEMVGIAGATGAGKSTLIKMLLRLYDVNAGAVRLDGIDIRELRQTDLRRRIALVTQDVYLFHGTIRENIAYGALGAGGEALDLAAVVAAARLAQMHEFIESLPRGYDSIVGERGIKLSGGQRQRLSLARAILKNAPVLVLDEATSSVDTETERLIQQNLQTFVAGRTAIVIAHRLSTIRHAHRILVLKDGRVHEEGGHDALVARGGVYADLWNVQSGNLQPA
jgi:ATP-binding cassette subfamily B protein